MSGLITFITENLFLLGCLAFAAMLYTMGSKSERIMLMIAGASLLTFSLSQRIDAALGVLLIGGGILLIDHLRTRT
jgi:hypothetical protein